MGALASTSRDVRLEVAPTGVTRYVVAPRAVVRLVALPRAAGGALELEVSEGAGVQLVVPEVARRTEARVEVASGAQLTVSVASSYVGEHELDVTVRLAGRGSSAHVQAAVVGGGSGSLWLKLSLAHEAANTYGRMTVRRCQADSSHSTFQGMLKVGSRAHGTDTYLSDKALLLGEAARAETNPGLEILADDVRASHGATVGRLPIDELFYVQSRGLPAPQAEWLLARAFLAPALTGVPPDVVAQLERNLAAYAPRLA